jgi:acetyltransferase
MLSIRRLDPQSAQFLEPLCELLIDTVHSGASVGFLAPVSMDTARNYWRGVFAEVGDSLCVWVAQVDGKIVGSVQLALCEKENGRHRAEVRKLFVLSSHRGQGVSRKLMDALEAHAGACKCSLLVLDTLVGSAAELVYQHLGWQKAGEIPFYAGAPDGTLHATAYYYKLADTLKDARG